MLGNDLTDMLEDQDKTLKAKEGILQLSLTEKFNDIQKYVINILLTYI